MTLTDHNSSSSNNAYAGRKKGQPPVQHDPYASCFVIYHLHAPEEHEQCGKCSLVWRCPPLHAAIWCSLVQRMLLWSHACATGCENDAPQRQHQITVIVGVPPGSGCRRPGCPAEHTPCPWLPAPPGTGWARAGDLSPPAAHGQTAKTAYGMQSPLECAPVRSTTLIQ